MLRSWADIHYIYTAWYMKWPWKLLRHSNHPSMQKYPFEPFKPLWKLSRQSWLTPNHSSDVSTKFWREEHWLASTIGVMRPHMDDCTNFHSNVCTFIQKLAQPQQWCFFQVLKRGALASTIGVMQPHMDDHTFFHSNGCTFIQKLAILSSFYNF